MRVRTLLVVAFLCVFGALHGSALSRARAQEADACGLCAGAREIKCPGCRGTAKAKGPCEFCDGERTMRCDWAHESPRRSTCDNCIGGKIRWDDGKVNSCKLCGGRGSSQCAGCKLAPRQKCKECLGMGHRQNECRACCGTAKLPCLVCSDAADCLACDRAEQVKCPRCRGSGEASQQCIDCVGHGKVPCEGCLGQGKHGCTDCYATGLARAQYQDRTTAYSKGCSACDKSGVRTCVRCQKGLARCEGCGGGGRLTGVCRLCSGKRLLPCGSCGEHGFRAADLQGSILLEKGEREAAAKLFRFAKSRAETRLRSAQKALFAVQSQGPARPKLPRIEDLRTHEQLVDAITALLAYQVASAAHRRRAARLEGECDELAALVKRLDGLCDELAGAKKAPR